MCAFLLALLLASPLSAQEPAKPPPLRWGGDKNGGAPFIFEDETGKLTGFEAEFAAYLAAKVGRTPVFVQDQWDNIPDLLKRPNLGRDGDIDVALNGFEYSPERHAEFPTSVPYYVYTFRLIGRADDDAVASWGGLGVRAEGKPRKTVGVLRGTAAQRYLEERYGEDVDVIKSETVVEMLQLVADGRVDATVQDAPAAAHYLRDKRFAGLRAVDAPAGGGFYVILTRPGDDRLREQLNAAVREAVRTGWLRDLYKRYRLWDAAQQRLAYLVEQPWPDVAGEVPTTADTPRTGAEPEKAEPEPPPPAVPFGKVARDLAAAAGMTVLLAVVSFPLAVVLGVAVAVARVYGPWPVRAVATAYVEVLRGTPLLLQLFVLFYLLPHAADWTGWAWLTAALSLSPFAAAVMGLALNYSAAEAENYRAGLLAVPAGQMEAALALGMSRATAVRVVVLPQAMRVVLPPVTNDFIALFKDTAVCSTILIVELTGLYYQYKSYPGDVGLKLAAAVAGLYLLMSYPLGLLARRLEARLARK